MIGEVFLNGKKMLLLWVVFSLISLERERERERDMNRNMQGFLIGAVGAAITLSAYEQTLLTPTQCVASGFLLLIFGLLVKEGFISL
ncbi:uncharacterized protein LOC131237982 [Magnolia sinica]|uniref:uncharacterized protein LOC131237982 n=1 Tax=Magnolia sinica TaxID=86752 RepID=UPI002659CC0F|nr:uncharacterized protein LOC131237982 [Magnolia sinica]